MKLDPAPTKTEYDEWAANATRPLTQSYIGAHSGHVRARCARLSKLWVPEKNLRVFRRPQSSAGTIEGEPNRQRQGQRQGPGRRREMKSEIRHLRRPGRVRQTGGCSTCRACRGERKRFLAKFSNSLLTRTFL